ncbi:MAG TPA: amidohydrolase [Caldilineaceae bacterium]|nr:amidohydrolase [Caldilineaceae bacterium]
MRSHALHPQYILYNGRLYTLDPEQPWASAIALGAGRIMAAGEDEEMLALRGPQTECINLEGRLALPGLCDAHIHLHEWALNQVRLHLAAARSKAEMLALVAARAESTPPGEWLLGQGWNESWWGETAFPTAADLDPVTGPERPTLLWRSDMHLAVANSAALHRAGITGSTEPPAGGVIDRDARGHPTGILRELAIGLVTRLIPEPTNRELDQALHTATRALHRMGVTAVHDQRIKDGREGPRMLAAYTRLRRREQLHLRVHCNIAAHQLGELAALGLQAGFGDDFLRLGHVKVFADGSLGSRTAWMLAPFAKLNPDEPDNLGVCVTPPDQMAAEFRRAAEIGFPISVHAIGDRANRTVLDIFEEMAFTTPPPPMPHRIEHVQTIDPEDLPRLAALGVTASVQPLHAPDDQDIADHFLGPRTRFTYAFRSLLSSGALLAFGSDAPVADPNPFAGIHAALYRRRLDRGPEFAWHPEEAVSLPDALHAYTLGAARAGGWERAIGSLAPGKRADLIVLDRDLFALAAEGDTGNALAETRVLMTFFDGRLVYEADEN